MRSVPPTMPSVVDQAVPSEVQSTVGSECEASVPVNGSVVWPGRAAVGREGDRLMAAAGDAVGRRDDLRRVPVVDPDVGFAARRRLRARGPDLAAHDRSPLGVAFGLLARLVRL